MPDVEGIQNLTKTSGIRIQDSRIDVIQSDAVYAKVFDFRPGVDQRKSQREREIAVRPGVHDGGCDTGTGEVHSRRASGAEP